jgi:hypothetical protein
MTHHDNLTNHNRYREIGESAILLANDMTRHIEYAQNCIKLVQLLVVFKLDLSGTTVFFETIKKELSEFIGRGSKLKETIGLFLSEFRQENTNKICSDLTQIITTLNTLLDKNICLIAYFTDYHHSLNQYK